MKKINAYLPLFPGFYESALEYSDTEYYAYHDDEDWLKEQYGEDITPDDFEFDYESRHQDIIDNFIEVYNNLSPDFVTEIKFIEMDSPKYYNFSTDKLWVEITLADEWRDTLIDFLSTDSKIKDLIYKNHTSYDGFISFMSNDVNEWIEELKKDEPDDIYIMYALVYYMAKDDGLQSLKEDLIYGALEDIYDGSYLNYVKKTA